jgi:hypothetical protein
MIYTKEFPSESFKYVAALITSPQYTPSTWQLCLKKVAEDELINKTQSPYENQ